MRLAASFALLALICLISGMLPMLLPLGGMPDSSAAIIGILTSMLSIIILTVALRRIIFF